VEAAASFRQKSPNRYDFGWREARLHSDLFTSSHGSLSAREIPLNGLVGFVVNLPRLVTGFTVEVPRIVITDYY